MRQGWRLARLGDVCTTIQDGAHESPKRLFDTRAEGRFPYITSKNIRMNHLDLDDLSYVERDFHDRIYPRCRPQVGDVLLTKDGANTGNVTLNTLDEPFSLLSSVCLIKPDPTVLSAAFVCYYLQSPDGLRGIVGQMTGAAIKRIILRNVRQATIPLPSVAEQHRIVATIDEAFAAIATARANAERNLRNARELFESYLDAMFKRRAERWRDVALGELCDVLDSRRIPITKRDRVAGDIPYYGATGVQDHVNGFIFDEPLVLVGEDGAKWGAGEPTAFAVSGKCWVNNHAHVLRPDRQAVLDPWLIYFLNHSDLTGFVSGLTVPKLNQSNLREIPIPVPPMPLQRGLTQDAQEAEIETERLVSTYKRKLVGLDALKQSFLHEAFTGAL